ncbi:peptidoglycan-binding domain-containing protein [Streptomyces sp. SHP 1-2]|uniref:peptidoglycan-binding domain-containing protein n=1 Tax=Streptomyces sp. SHP 1-2 TaxID=2769489 RepID=UPI0022388932|nr:peptidoglycan-binding domain-containing protein [Streptomyces sp. SHP 1-2]MCW5254709.1 peptidoglycan-binding protein [Streptomyces sp. SHP 1-2]
MMLIKKRAVKLLTIATLSMVTAGISPVAAQAASTVQNPSTVDYCSESYSQNHPTIARGSAGNAVRHAQCKLGKWGHPVTVDGIFGDNTYNAVRAVQGDCNLTRDGIIGPKTWRCLD